MTFTGREVAALVGCSWLSGVAALAVVAGLRLAWVPLVAFTVYTAVVIAVVRRSEHP